jgi:hypothetical protein
MKTLRSIAIGTAIGMSAAVSVAGTASSFFSVQITLHTGIVTPPVIGPPVIVPPAPPPDNGGGGGATPEPPSGGGSTPAPPPVDVADGNPPAPPPGVLPPTPGPVQVSAPSTGICTSQSASSATQAVVRVVCSTGQFVSIESSPGRPFVGTHGGAYRFNFGPGLPTPALASNFNLNIGAGTVTALRIVHTNGSQAPIEMLVSF